MTLKPAAFRCHVCKSVSAFEGDRSVCHSICSTGGPTTPLFTRDDLVRAVAMGQKVHEDCEPAAIVAEMLGEVEK